MPKIGWLLPISPFVLLIAVIAIGVLIARLTRKVPRLKIPIALLFLSPIVLAMARFHLGGALLFSFVGFGAFLTRRIPAISIPVGFILTIPFVLAMAEQHVLSENRSASAMLIPVILAILFAVALWGVFLFVSGMRCLRPRIQLFVVLGVVLSTTSIAGVVMFRWSQMNIEHVVASAGNIAGAKPYCIDVASGYEGNFRYKEARSRSDLSGYRMRAPKRGGSRGHHAILAVVRDVHPELYFWSYGKKAFIRDTGKPQSVYCQPRLSFAKTLSDG